MSLQISSNLAPNEERRNKIQGSGEMADRVREYRWEDTPLGAIGTWSDTLITAVNHMLFSPFSFAIFWGEEQILLYNDIYRNFLNDKHPQALASEASEVWAEAWDVLGGPVRAAFEKGISTGERAAYIPILVEGEMQDRWWTYGFNPIFQDGKIVGVANPGQEDTGSFLAERALRKSQEEFDLGMESAGIGMWHYDFKTNIVVADEKMYRIFGSPVKVATVDYWLDLLHPDDRDRVGAHFRGAIAGLHRYDIEYRIMRNEEVRWVRSKGNALGSEEKRLFAIIEDITERKQAEAALQQNEKLAAVGRLAASIAHEVNNPLEAVTNLLYLVKGSTELSEIQDYVDTAEQELRRVALITNQTLRFHKQSTHASPAFCYDLIGDSLAMYQGRVKNNQVQVEKRKRAEHPVNCLSGEIRQVLNNFIGNALDSMPHGGRLLLRSREGTNWKSGQAGLVITVADTGTGMTSETQKKLFDAFYTTKGLNGTGLGLWISKELASEGGPPFDFIFIDADKPNNPAYLDWSLKLSRPGTVIIGDNVIRDGAIVDPNNSDARVQGVQKFFDNIAGDRRLTATAVQTVGSKGYDGFALALVEEM